MAGSKISGLSAASALTGTEEFAVNQGGVSKKATAAQVVAAAVPTGTIQMYGGTTAPSGWALCNGSAKSTTTEAALFAAIGYRFGGSGSSFNLPNLTDRFPVGTSGTKAVGETGGSATKTIETANLPPHTHPITRAGSTGGNANTVARGDSSAAGSADTGGGGFANTPLDVMNPWVAVSYIIKL